MLAVPGFFAVTRAVEDLIRLIFTLLRFAGHFIRNTVIDLQIKFCPANLAFATGLAN